MDAGTTMYLVAILPGEDISQEVTGFKEYMASYFGACHALKSPPHITLIPPFRWLDLSAELLAVALEAFSCQQIPFELSLRDFNRFDEKVIFVGVEPCRELDELERDLVSYLESAIGLKRNHGLGFHPHMTIAHRDLSRDAFPSAWNYFSSLRYHRSFPVDALACLRHKGGLWEVWRSFSMVSG